MTTPHMSIMIRGAYDTIVVDYWKYSMLLLYILWDDWPMFMISCSNEQLQQQLEYALLKPDCHSCWISKMQSAREEERYAIEFCLKLGIIATETYRRLRTAIRPSCMNRASVFELHKRFKEGRESVRNDETWLPHTFAYSLSLRKNLDAVVMRQLGRWQRLWRRSLTRSHKRTSRGPMRSCWNGTTSALQLEEIILKGE